MPLGKRVQALPGNELLRDLPLELNAVGTLSCHGFHPLQAPAHPVKSLTSNCPAPGAHSKPTSPNDSLTGPQAVIRSNRLGDGSVVSCLHGMNDPQPEGHMASHIGRREFLATLGGAAAAWPLAARAQQPAMPLIGFLRSSRAEGFSFMTQALWTGLGEKRLRRGP